MIVKDIYKTENMWEKILILWFSFLSYIFKNLYVYDYGVSELPPCF